MRPDRFRAVVGLSVPFRPRGAVRPTTVMPKTADAAFYMHRIIDRNWELLAPWAGANVSVPALYLAGERDLVLGFGGTDKVLASLKQIVPNLRQARILPGCGHWTQQERPAEVNAAVLEFLKTL